MTRSVPILGITPLAWPDVSLVRSLVEAGAIGCLDLGCDPRIAKRALRRAAHGGEPFAVRVGRGAPAVELPALVTMVVLDAGVDPSPFAGKEILVQVTTPDEARDALAHDIHGLIAKGAESGGRVSDTAAPILVQQLLPLTDLPVWVQGGIGEHTAAGAIALGAHGLVLDGQLALLEESSLPDTMRRLVESLDGSETTLAKGYRVLTRPGVPVEALAESLPSILGPGPLDERLVPLGQDAALAPLLASRFRTVRALVLGLRDAVYEHLEIAALSQPLAPGRGVAGLHGSRYPIAQGPMTRVSDRASFAEAVAEGGGLPFLALSLSRGSAVRELMEETAMLLGDQPWGVGVLGFVPPELRAEQLAVIADLRPPLALIAGGRPSQARELEAMGIPTYLHVPSPGLLDLFLRDGARRFVFEGRECGGHIGPRHSFVLWEQAIERLLGETDLSGVEVLFAGGIHDGLSAAMVAAIAAPIVERGARIGVLMGTAYLFTEEAVASGAIGTVFQDAAIGATRTSAVQTAPGHATRCVDSPFVTAFEARRDALRAEGLPPETIWAELEKMNLGRLRIASKGIVRDGEDLVEVSEDRQRADGMFMIGDVATLRDRRTTIAELHAEVSEGSAACLRAWVGEDVDVDGPGPVDVAIVGMAGFFPGAPDVHTFWSNILAGVDSVTEVPHERWNPELYFDPDHIGGERTRSKWGGFLPPIPFDPLVFGIPPRSLSAVEPVQLLALEAARRALVDAGYDRRHLPRSRTSVLFGAEAGTDLAGAYGFRAVWPSYMGELPPELDAVLPRLTEDSFPGVLANVIAGRIANRLDLGGVNYTVDAACASSLAALDQACRELSTGASDVVLCGGADLHNTINDYLLFSSTHALSPKGRCATFDADADGIALGESVSVVVLKRLEDAERDGDRIYAVVRAVAGSSDGRSLGLTAPRKAGQVRALERAYARAQVDPRRVELVEAHGTGTVVGDRTEIETLTDVFQGHDPGAVTLGSVKSQIGHTKCAAGLAGLIKIALALHHRVLPPTLHVQQPNPGWQGEDSPFGFRSRPVPWTGEDRHAAVSAFGFGGTNFHAVLAAHDTATVGANAWPAELCVLRDLDDLDRLEAFATTDASPPLRSIARALASRGTGAVQLAIVATDHADLAARIQDARAGRAHPRIFRRDAVSGKVGWLFPGQGSQRPNMLSDLLVHWPQLQRHLDRGEVWASRLYPADAFTIEGRKAQRAALTDTRVAQPTLGIAGLAAAELLDLLDVPVDAMAGHSYGELVALTVAGALPEEELLSLSQARGKAILAAAGDAPGTMLAVSSSREVLEPYLAAEAEVVLANHNAPEQCVLSGTTAGIARILSALEADEIPARSIPVAAAFHSPVVQGAAGRLAKHLSPLQMQRPRIPVYSNTTAEPHDLDPEAIRTALADHVEQPVRWVDLIERMYADGIRTFVEVGPGRVLSGLTSKILGSRPHRTVAMEEDDQAGLAGFLGAVGTLLAAGVDLDLEALFDGRRGAPANLDGPPPTHSMTTWMVNGHRSVPLHGPPPETGLQILERPLDIVGRSPTLAEGGRDEVVLSYLESMRQLAEAQRQAVLGYLGTQAPAAITLDAIQAQPALEVDAAPESTELVVAVSAEDALLELVSDRTGYPRDMLDLDLDLEADLSIDSIKRIEILGALSEKLGLADASQDARDALVEELARVKTLRGILAWLADKQGGGASAEPAQLTAVEETEEPSVQAPASTERFVPELTPAPMDDAPLSLTDRRIAVVGSGTIADALLASITARGAAGRSATAEDSLDDVDGIVWLAHDDDHPTLPILSLADAARRVLTRGEVPMVVVTGGGGTLDQSTTGTALSGAIAGFTKSISHEWPGLRLRRVDIDPASAIEATANQVLDELLVADALPEVGYADGTRHTVLSRHEPLNGAARVAPLSEGDVLVVTGGARGITARVAIDMARAWKPTLELIGRSPMPGEADLALIDALTENDLRRRLIELGRVSSPADAARGARRELADRQMRTTFATLDGLGVRWRYHAVDVRDDEAFGALLDQITAEHGRIDGVIHGAGITEDKLLRDKTRESFQRVYDTKVSAALLLSERLDSATKLVVFFSSVAGAYGNRGQTDYAAANATLDALAHKLQGRIAGRAVSINWGPWGGGGMVSAELAREYDRKGIALIEPADGVERLMHELEAGTGSQVILMRAHPEQLLPRT